MCLDHVQRHVRKPMKDIVIAWKVLDYDGVRNEYEPLARARPRWHFPCKPSAPLRFDRWMKAPEDTPGFHVFATKDGAENWFLFDEVSRAIKVRVRYVTMIGRESGRAAMIAREMFVPKPSRRKRSK